jgi:hypothetical protein
LKKPVEEILLIICSVKLVECQRMKSGPSLSRTRKVTDGVVLAGQMRADIQYESGVDEKDTLRLGCRKSDKPSVSTSLAKESQYQQLK